MRHMVGLQLKSILLTWTIVSWSTSALDAIIKIRVENHYKGSVVCRPHRKIVLSRDYFPGTIDS